MEKVIVQDTDKDVLDILTIALQNEGFLTLPIENCENILSRINEFRPHVVMLDYRMKGAECIEACRIIKARYPHLPVVALSCNSNINAVYSLHGFDDYIAKPFDLDHLYETLRKYIPEQKKRAGVAEKAQN